MLPFIFFISRFQFTLVFFSRWRRLATLPCGIFVIKRSRNQLNRPISSLLHELVIDTFGDLRLKACMHGGCLFMAMCGSNCKKKEGESDQNNFFGVNKTADENMIGQRKMHAYRSDGSEN